MIVESGSSDVTYTKEISGVHANFLTKSIINAGLDPTKLKATNKEIDFGKELSEAKGIEIYLFFLFFDFFFRIQLGKIFGQLAMVLVQFKILFQLMN